MPPSCDRPEVHRTGWKCAWRKHSQMPSVLGLRFAWPKWETTCKIISQRWGSVLCCAKNWWKHFRSSLDSACWTATAVAQLRSTLRDMRGSWVGISPASCCYLSSYFLLNLFLKIINIPAIDDTINNITLAYLSMWAHTHTVFTGLQVASLCKWQISPAEIYTTRTSI